MKSSGGRDVQGRLQSEGERMWKTKTREPRRRLITRATNASESPLAPTLTEEFHCKRARAAAFLMQQAARFTEDLGEGERSHPRSRSFSKHNAQRLLRWGMLRLRVMFGDRADTHAVPAQTFQCSRRKRKQKKTFGVTRTSIFQLPPVNVRKHIYSLRFADAWVSRRTGLSEERWWDDTGATQHFQHTVTQQGPGPKHLSLHDVMQASEGKQIILAEMGRNQFTQTCDTLACKLAGILHFPVWI